MRRATLAITALLLLPPHAVWAVDTAADTIENFYQEYLTTDSTDRMKRRPAFSQGFLHDEALNKKSCEQFAGTDQCGWDASFNPYLNAQDYSSDLTFHNANVHVKEEKPNTVDVTLSIFPDAENEMNTRKITYLMLREQGNWVVDNIIADSGDEKKPFMARRVMLNEIARYQNKALQE